MGSAAAIGQNQHMQTPSEKAPARRAEVLAALSVAIDLGLGQPAEHMLRSAVIACRLADRLDLSDEQRGTVYYTTLVMWVGCRRPRETARRRPRNCPLADMRTARWRPWDLPDTTSSALPRSAVEAPSSGAMSGA